MKRTLLALAVVGAFSSAAMAQSSVTLYGRVDLSARKQPNTDQKDIANGSGGRLGVRGVEDLGGGLQALFNLEHGFDADTGAVTQIGQFTPTTGNSIGEARRSTNARFWGRRSVVGLQGPFGAIYLGREYTAAYLQSQNPSDPWGWDTVVAGSGVAQNRGTTGITGGGIASVRNDSSISYKFSMSGFTLGAQVAEAGGDNINTFVKRPVNGALSYAAGPISAAISYERTGLDNVDKEYWATANAAWDFGVVKIGGFFGKGQTAFGIDRKSYMVTATAPIGSGELRAMYGQRKGELNNDDAKGIKAGALGYHYSLSKRTVIYTDYIRDSGTLITGSKNGYDFGIKHNF